MYELDSSVRQDDNNEFERLVRWIDLSLSLSLEDEIDLANKIRDSKDSIERIKYINEFMSHYYRLIISVINSRYANFAHSMFNELFQEWCIGLRLAVENFDPERWNRFATYAAWLIRRVISQYLFDFLKIIRLPVSIIKKLNKFNSKISKLLYTNNNPTISEIALCVWFTEKEVINLLSLPKTISLFTPLQSSELELHSNWDTIWDLIHWEYCDIDDFMNREQLQKIFLFTNLSSRELTVITKRFWLNPEREEMTCEEIWKEFKCSKENIRLIEKKAISKLQRTAKRIRA